MATSFAVSPHSLSSPAPGTTTMEGDDETKDLDTPKTIMTSESSSCDAHYLETPPPMHGRLGRIILSSGAYPTISDGSTATSCCSEHIETGCPDGSPPNSQLHRSIRRAGNHSQLQRVSTPLFSQEIDENDESLEMLLNALNKLNRLATLDSAEYQQRLLENSLPSLEGEKSNSIYCPSLSQGNTRTQIRLPSQPILTPLVQLSMSIHRLHAVIANVTREIDGHTDEVKELQSQLEVLKKRNRKLESATKIVHKRNLKLKKQSQHDRKVAKLLQHKVHKYEAQIESQDFELMASKVYQHEIQLQLTKSQKNNATGCSGISDDHLTRERLDSNMSDFFDVEKEIEGVALASVQSDLSETTAENIEKESSDIIADTSRSAAISKTNAMSDYSSSALRFSADRSVVTKKSTNSSNKEASSPQSIRHPPSTPETGDRKSSLDAVDKLDKNSSKDAKTPKAENKGAMLSNRFSMFLGQRSIPNYNLKMTPPCNLQFVELEVKSIYQENEEGGKQSQVPESQGLVEDHGILQTHDDSSQYLTRDNATSQKKDTIFAVCGFEGFNTEINMKPTLGARLAKINGRTIDRDWTLEKLYRDLEGISNNTKGGKTKPIVLTFRNEIWDKEQANRLSTAIRQGIAEAAGTIPQKNPGGSQHHRRLSNTKSCNERDGSYKSNASEHFQRARTASADSVGKAINGFGSFLQNFGQIESGC